MTQGRQPGWVDYALLAVLAALWGGSFTLIKLTVGDFPPAMMTFLRLAVAALVMICVAFWLDERLILTPRVAGNLLMVGIFGNTLPFVLIAWGQQSVDANLAAILMGIMPIATLLFAHFLAGDETLTTGKLVGAFVGLIGLVILVGPSVLYRLGDDGVRQLAILGAAVSYGVNAVLTKRLLGLPRRAAAAGILIAGALTVLPISLLTEDWSTATPHFASVSAIVALGLFPTALASLLVFVVLERQGAGFFGQVNLLVPLMGVAWAVLFLGEKPEANAWIALFVIMAGLAIARRPAQSNHFVA